MAQFETIDEITKWTGKLSRSKAGSDKLIPYGYQVQG